MIRVPILLRLVLACTALLVAGCRASGESTGLPSDVDVQNSTVSSEVQAVATTIDDGEGGVFTYTIPDLMPWIRSTDALVTTRHVELIVTSPDPLLPDDVTVQTARIVVDDLLFLAELLTEEAQEAGSVGHPRMTAGPVVVFETFGPRFGFGGSPLKRALELAGDRSIVIGLTAARSDSQYPALWFVSFIGFVDEELNVTLQAWDGEIDNTVADLAARTGLSGVDTLTEWVLEMSRARSVGAGMPDISQIDGVVSEAYRARAEEEVARRADADVEAWNRTPPSERALDPDMAPAGVVSDVQLGTLAIRLQDPVRLAEEAGGHLLVLRSASGVSYATEIGAGSHVAQVWMMPGETLEIGLAPEDDLGSFVTLTTAVGLDRDGLLWLDISTLAADGPLPESRTLSADRLPDAVDLINLASWSSAEAQGTLDDSEKTALDDLRARYETDFPPLRP